MSMIVAASRSLPLVLLFAFAPSLHAQNCTGTIAANINSVSVSTGGVQLIDLTVAPSQFDLQWQIIGSFGTNTPTPWFSYGGLNLNLDRYMFRMLNGHGGFVHGAINGYIGGPLIPFNTAGQAQLQVVIPQGLSSHFIGKTLHHGMYYTSQISLLPTCGTPTVALTLLP
ncbi:MAG TPA: hypothetical protein VK843_15115 [Planctomycetota bacterium]|nr:hypothetical protein [Planctomycetota bacterium]